jgi:hypothetical protein
LVYGLWREDPGFGDEVANLTMKKRNLGQTLTDCHVEVSCGQKDLCLLCLFIGWLAGENEAR